MARSVGPANDMSPCQRLPISSVCFWRAANDWFGYELNARAEENLTLQLTHWGNAWRPEDFTVEINGAVVGTVPVTGTQGDKFIVHSLAVPAETDVLRVVFRPAPGSPRVPPLYEIRLVRAAQN